MSLEAEKRGAKGEGDGAPVTKKQRTIVEPAELTAPEFTKLLQGPVVTILIGSTKEKYTLPKALAEYYSPVLERAFNGRFKEAEEQSIHFPEEDSRDMELVLQWMYSDGTNIKLNEAESSNGEATILRWIDFAGIGDRLDLHGSSSFSAVKIKSVLVDHYTAGEGSTITQAAYLPISEGCIRTAINFPVSHPVRSILAEAIAPSFLTCLKQKSTSTYRFRKEIDELECFRSDLFLALEQIQLRAQTRNSGYTCCYQEFSICNITGDEILLRE